MPTVQSFSGSAASAGALATHRGRVTRIVMLGRQGSGKGTQCERLVEFFGVAHISTGALFRDAVARDTPLGRSIKALIEAGDLVPDGFVVEVVAEWLTRSDVRTNGFVLDGFPRTVEQAEALAVLLGSQTIDVAINLAIDPGMVLERLLQRRVCADCSQTVNAPSGTAQARCPRCGGHLVRRDDDTRSVIARRLALYEQQTRPILAWYARHGLLATVDGHGSRDEVAGRVERACWAWRPSREDSRQGFRP